MTYKEKERSMKNKKVVLVTGGTGGIGKYLVEEFFRAGYCVAFTFYSNAEAAGKLEKLPNVKGFQADVADEASVAKLRDDIEAVFGGLDALVFGSGIFEDALVENMSLDSWNRVISTNLTGVFLCAKYMLAMLRKSGHGRFICIGSVMGDTGIYGSCSYAASKTGMIGLVKSIALENAKHGVTANVVSFGYIDAGMTARLPEKVLDSALKKIPMKRMGDPTDTAKVIIDLCAEHTNYISGQVIRVNGLMYV